MIATDVVPKPQERATQRLLQASRETTANHTKVDFCAKPPRIGIINRKNNRGIINAEQLVNDLNEFRYVYRNHAGKTPITVQADQPVENIFFEGLDFLGQVEFFRRTDILITGHGAQLTGIPFIATDIDPETRKSCKQVLEIFPYYYFMPKFFGGLAVQSGVGHNYVYYDDTLRRDFDQFENIPNPRPPIKPRPIRHALPWETITHWLLNGRHSARDHQFCPRRDDFTSYAAQLVQKWYQCHGC